MKEYTQKDLDQLAEANKDIENLKDFVADRVNLYRHIHDNVDPVLKKLNGYNIYVNLKEIFDPKITTIKIKKIDNQYGGNAKEYEAPKDFIFNVNNDEEKEFNEYLKLKNKFEKKI